MIDDAVFGLQFPVHGERQALSGLGTTSTAQVSAPVSDRSLSTTQRAISNPMPASTPASAAVADPAGAPNPTGYPRVGVCFDRNSLTRALAAVKAAPVFHSAMNSQFGSSFESSSEIG
jgi:hypothetical protein